MAACGGSIAKPMHLIGEDVEKLSKNLYNI